ncbi:MAG TPA: acyltransferase [bacterium]|nr:acyltransferase [bacterium]
MNNKHNIHPSAYVDPGAELGSDVIIGAFSFIGKGVCICDNVQVSHNAVIGKQPQLGANSTAVSSKVDPTLSIGDGTRIGAGAIINIGSKTGSDCVIGDNALVRENVHIGNNVIIGAHVVIENDVLIGNRTKIQTKAYITAMSVLEEDVFIAPCVITTNDNYMGRTEERFKYKGGAKIKRGARVGAGTIILPNIVIGCEAFVAAGSIVTKNVAESTLVMGSPARPIRKVNEKELIDNQ